MEFLGPLLMMRVMHLVLADGRPDLERLRARASAHVHHFCESVKTKEAPVVKPASRRRA
jgi:hypothetical protein